jgi:hypothetical protein
MDTPTKRIEAKNGLAFEVILGSPKATTPAKLTTNNTPTRNLSNEDIKIKLQRAEERRQVSQFNRFAVIFGQKDMLMFYFVIII